MFLPRGQLFLILSLSLSLSLSLFVFLFLHTHIYVFLSSPSLHSISLLLLAYSASSSAIRRSQTHGSDVHTPRVIDFRFNLIKRRCAGFQRICMAFNPSLWNRAIVACTALSCNDNSRDRFSVLFFLFFLFFFANERTQAAKLHPLHSDTSLRFRSSCGSSRFSFVSCVSRATLCRGCSYDPVTRN